MVTKVSPFRIIGNNPCHLYIVAAPATRAEFSYRVAMSREIKQGKKAGRARIQRAAPAEAEDLNLAENPISSETPARPPAPSVSTALPSFLESAVRQAPSVVATGIPFASRFTIAESFLGHEWQVSKRPEADLVYSLRGVTPDIEQKSADVAGVSGSVVSMMQHQMLLCVCKIGGKLTNQNHAQISSWLHDIGSKGRSCVLRSFHKMNSASEDELATFLGTEEPDFDF